METFADYHKEREAFLSLTEPDCRNRIQFFKGASGSGKTSLINSCKNNICDPVHCVSVTLRGINTADIFWKAVSRLGWDRFPDFTDQLSSFSGVNVNIDRNKIKGDRNQIQVTLHGDKDEREYRRNLLTDAWFNDIENIDVFLLMAMDAYEQAVLEIKDWICNSFLARTAAAPNIRVAIAGQEVPETDTIEDWIHCCETHELFGVEDAEHWMPVVETLKKRIPVDPPFTWMAGICHALKGRPDAIMKIIQGLPGKHE